MSEGVSGHCPSSWPALPQDRWQWPSCPSGGSCHSPGPRPSPEDQGGPRPGLQGYAVLNRLVGPACIFLRPSIAITQLVCTAARLPARLPARLLPPRSASP